MKPLHTAKPEHSPFVVLPLILLAAILSILASIATLLLPIPAWIAPTTAIAAFILLAANQQAKHTKTRTEFYKKRIVHHTGGLISDHTTTLEIHNITHVKLIHPFIKHALFNTSHLAVQAAGSGAIEVQAKDILQGEHAYNQLHKRMQQNGFSLQRNTLLQQENPLTEAVIIKQLAVIAFALILLGPGTIIPAIFAGPLIAIPALLVATTLIVGIIIYSLDEIRREYNIYEDTIEYHEGFLTKRHSFIPAENLAEANNTQQIIDRLLRTSNIVISTQGSGQTTFKNMPRGEDLEKTIDELAKAYKPLTKQATTQKTTTTKTTAQTTNQTTSEQATSTHQQKQYFPRAAITAVLAGLLLALIAAAYSLFELITGEFHAPLLLAIIGFAFIAGTSKGILEALFTTYEIRARGVYTRYEFIKRTTQEFTDDKLVGIQVTKTPLDHLLKTANITFQSLSSAPNITFKYVRGYEELLEELTNKYYLNTPHKQTIHAAYKPTYLLAKNFLQLSALAATLIAATITLRVLEQPIWVAQAALALAALAVSATLLGQYLRYKKSHLSLHEEHVKHAVGFIKQTTTYARYEDLKHQQATNYRLTPVGGLYLGVGGTSTQEEREQHTTNGIYAGYLPQAHKLLDAIDQKILKEQKGFNKPTHTSKPSLKNPALTHALLAIPTLGISAALLPVTLWRTNKYSYHLEKLRVVEYRGVWNRYKHSVLYKNLDHLSNQRGLTNKLFSNGTIHLYTLGSAGVEIAIRNIQEYDAWKQHIENNYR